MRAECGLQSKCVLAALSCFLLFSVPASAEKLTAVCKDIGGYRVDDTNGKLVGGVDKLTDVS